MKAQSPSQAGESMKIEEWARKSVDDGLYFSMTRFIQQTAKEWDNVGEVQQDFYYEVLKMYHQLNIAR